jgi:hypothetical protein
MDWKENWCCHDKKINKENSFKVELRKSFKFTHPCLPILKVIKCYLSVIVLNKLKYQNQSKINK